MKDTSVTAQIRFDAVDQLIDGRAILSGVSVDLNARRIGVIGRNGSGKTTFARLLAGLVAPTAGAVTIDGINPAKDRRAALALVGILFQNPDHQIIFPTVIEEVAFGLRQLGQDDPDARALAVLERFGKAHWRDAHVHSLSQGQKQLVCLMSILAMTPRILILDEPFAGLDIPTRMQLARYLDRYDGTLVHVSHDPRDLAGYDQVLWLDRGALQAQGVAGDVLAAFTDDMTKQGEGDDISDLSR
ncbi:energy-coupling factor ABC transporter ATP-binding protein (plasmid) [Aliiroseovarius sp. M344]|uniref:energy-coupling factor ABC transporter ATP-binding protein n=1 Tax=Aliiroseovarius sp. M344 TaxID=2867010 RepID=UPI0021AE015D|nr:ABC transporter ATP-binding protein [Aliiroseovarius sp. M344]UWQ16022.1 energy-coupling factor ABC transporter ATP-binding protein [Aliiroseovarius sp. M344]